VVLVRNYSLRRAGGAAFLRPTVDIKQFAISQTTRCHLSSAGMSGNKYIDSATAEKFYAACVRTPRTSFGYMGYSLRSKQWRCMSDLGSELCLS
jgi:hypothetical protein